MVALSLLCCAVFLPGITTLPVRDRDDARFAQASKASAARSIDLICCDGEPQNFTKPPRFLPNRAFELGQH